MHGINYDIENIEVLNVENIEHIEKKTNIDVDYKKSFNLTCNDTKSKHLAEETISQIFLVSLLYSGCF